MNTGTPLAFTLAGKRAETWRWHPAAASQARFMSPATACPSSLVLDNSSCTDRPGSSQVLCHANVENAEPCFTHAAAHTLNTLSFSRMLMQNCILFQPSGL